MTASSADAMEMAMDRWLLDLYEYGFVVVDTKNTHYAHAESAVGVLRRRGKREYGLILKAEVLGPHKAVIEVVK